MQRKMLALSGALVVGVLAWSTAIAAESEKGVKVGDDAPMFELKDLDGKTHKLADHKDKIVVLEWFSHHCPFVQNAAEFMAKNSAKYAEKGVVWMAVDSTDPEHRSYVKPEKVKAYAKEHKLNYPILQDADGKVGKMYGAETTPHMFILKHGKVVYIGGHDNGTGVHANGSRNYIAETLDALLDGKDVPSPTTQNRGCSVKYARN